MDKAPTGFAEPNPKGDDVTRFAIVLGKISASGLTRTALELCRGLIARGHTVDVLVWERIDPNVPLPAGVPKPKLITRQSLFSANVTARMRLYKLMARAPRLTAPSWMQALSGLIDEVNRLKPEVLIGIHSRSNLLALTAAQLATCQTQVIATEHGIVSDLHRGNTRRNANDNYFYRSVYNRANKIVCNSRSVMQDLQDRFGLEEAKLAIVPNGIDIAEAQRLAALPVDHPWLLNKTTPVILGVGRLSPIKRYDLLIDAFSRLTNSDSRLIILGEGDERGRLTALRDRLGLQDRVDLPGQTANPFAHMSRADLLVQPSQSEGFGNVLIEAAACGLPAISTDCTSACAEIFSILNNGLIVPKNDPAAMAEAIQRSLRSTVNRRQLRTASQAFNNDVLASKFEAFASGGRKPGALASALNGVAAE